MRTIVLSIALIFLKFALSAKPKDEADARIQAATKYIDKFGLESRIDAVLAKLVLLPTRPSVV